MAQDFAKNKNPQLLSNLYETWWKYSSSECFKFLQYQLDWIKIVDFFQGRLFLGVELFPEPKIETDKKRKINQNFFQKNILHFLVLDLLTYHMF